MYVCIYTHKHYIDIVYFFKTCQSLLLELPPESGSQEDFGGVQVLVDLPVPLSHPRVIVNWSTRGENPWNIQFGKHGMLNTLKYKVYEIWAMNMALLD